MHAYGHREVSGGLALLVAVSVLAFGCAPLVGKSDAPAPPDSLATTPASLSPDQMAEAERFRVDFGLRSDAAWIMEVARDPASDRATFGVPLTTEEIAELQRRARDVDQIRAIVIAYGEDHPEEWAGAYIDHEAGGALIAQFAGNVNSHRIALLTQVWPKAKVEVRSVRWSLDALRSFGARLPSEEPWFASIPAVLTGFGPNVVLNRVEIQVSSANPAASELILAHFGWDSSVAVVKSDGTGALLLPTGSLVIRAVDQDGDPVSGLACVAVPDVAGAYEPRPIPMPRTDTSGACTLELPATGYDVSLERGHAPPRVVGQGRAVVAPEETSHVVIRVQE